MFLFQREKDRPVDSFHLSGFCVPMIELLVIRAALDSSLSKPDVSKRMCVLRYRLAFAAADLCLESSECRFEENAQSFLSRIDSKSGPERRKRVSRRPSLRFRPLPILRNLKRGSAFHTKIPILETCECLSTKLIHEINVARKLVLFSSCVAENMANRSGFECMECLWISVLSQSRVPNFEECQTAYNVLVGICIFETS